MYSDKASYCFRGRGTTIVHPLCFSSPSLTTVPILFVTGSQSPPRFLPLPQALVGSRIRDLFRIELQMTDLCFRKCKACHRYEKKGRLAKAGDTCKKQCLLEHSMATLPLELSAYLSGCRVSSKDLLPSEYFLALSWCLGFYP